MKIAILGTGNYAKAIGSRILHAGHVVVYGSRRVKPSGQSPFDSSSAFSINGDGPITSPTSSMRLAKSFNPAEPQGVEEHLVVAPSDAVKGADLVIMAIPITGHAEMANLIQNHLSSEVVIIDVSNTTFSKTAAQRHADQMEASVAALEAAYKPSSSYQAKKFAKIMRKQRKTNRHLDKLLHGKDSKRRGDEQESSKVQIQDDALLPISPLSPPTTSRARVSPSQGSHLVSASVTHEDDPNHKLNCTDPCCNPEAEEGEEIPPSETTPLFQGSSRSSTHDTSTSSSASRSTPSTSAQRALLFAPYDTPTQAKSVPDIENLHMHPKLQRQYNSSTTVDYSRPSSPSDHHCSSPDGTACVSCPAGSSGDVKVKCPSTSPWDMNCAQLSNAEHLQRLLPHISVVKAFNTISAYALLAGPGAVQEDRVLVCADERWAKEKVFDLIVSMGMRPVDSGPLMSARNVEKKSVTFFEDWRAACWISAGLFLFATLYIMVRDIILSHGYFQDLLLLKFNVIVAWHALALFTVTFLAGAVAALRQLFTGTAKVAFPNWLDKWLRARTSLGLMGLASAAVHMIAAVMTDHLFVDFGYIRSLQGSLYQGSIFSALLSLLIYTALAATSIPSVGSNLSWREWTFVQSKLGIFGLALGATHAALMIFALGDLPNVKAWPYYLAPASLLITAAAIILLIIRIILAIPVVSRRLNRIRGGT
jgi:predicted dinucleotide-binding enzyme